MKQRKIKIEVFKIENAVKTIIFFKDNCTPQDIISSLSLFGDDGVRFSIFVDDVELSVPQQQN